MLALLAAGCEAPLSLSDWGEIQAGNIQVKMTDAPNPDVEKVEVTFTGVRVHAADGSLQDEEEEEELNEEETSAASQTKKTDQNRGKGQDKDPKQTDQSQPQTQAEQDGGSAEKSNGDSTWITLDLDSDADEVTFNLLDYRDGLEKLVAMGEQMAAGKYTQIRLEVSQVLVTFKDGTQKEARLPSDTLKFVHPFEIVAGKTTVLVFDWDAEKSLVFTGNGEIICKPVIKLLSTNIINDEEETEEPDEESIEITSELPDGTIEEDYCVELTAEGGNEPYYWTLFDGELPPGLTLEEDEEECVFSITGIPTEAGEFIFTLEVVDSSDPELSDTSEFTVIIAEAQEAN